MLRPQHTEYQRPQERAGSSLSPDTCSQQTTQGKEPNVGNVTCRSVQEDLTTRTAISPCVTMDSLPWRKMVRGVTTTETSTMTGQSITTQLHSNPHDNRHGGLDNLSLDAVRKWSKQGQATWQLRKVALHRPHDVDIYRLGEQEFSELTYRKRRTHSYSWGFQNNLYTQDDIQVGEARRGALDQEQVLFEMIHYGRVTARMEWRQCVANDGFCVQGEFEEQRVRWRRLGALSHDLTLELEMQRSGTSFWRAFGGFESHGWGLFVQIGELVVDQQALGLVTRTDQFEAFLILTCCTALDLMSDQGVIRLRRVGMGGGQVGSGHRVDSEVN